MRRGVERYGAMACSLFVVATVWACGSAPVAEQPPARVTEARACHEARVRRDRARQLAEEGWLERAARALSAANATCPGERAVSWQLELALLVELGHDAAARALIRRIRGEPEGSSIATAAAEKTLGERASWSRDPVAAAAARASAEDAAERGVWTEAAAAYLEAWRHARPNGHDLYLAADASERAGQIATARKLYDRAVADFERQDQRRVRVTHDGIDSHGWRNPRWSPDGTVVAFLTAADVVLVDAQSWQPRYRFPRLGGVEARFSDDGRLAIVDGVTDSGELVARAAWDTATGARAPAPEPPRRERPAIGPRVEQAGSYTVTMNDTGLEVTRSGRVVRTIDHVSCWAIVPGAEALVVALWKRGELALVPLAHGAGPVRLSAIPPGHGCTHVRFDDSGRFLLGVWRSGDSQSSVFAIDIESRQRVFQSSSTKGDLAAPRLRRGGRVLEARAHDAGYVWSFPAGDPLILEANALSFSPDERRVAYVCDRGSACMIDLDSPDAVHEVGSPPHVVSAVPTPGGAMWIATSDNKLWWLELAAERTAAVHLAGGEIGDLQPASEGGRLLARDARGAVSLWDTRERRLVFEVDAGARDARPSPRGDFVLVDTGEELIRYDEHGRAQARYPRPAVASGGPTQDVPAAVWIARDGLHIAAEAEAQEPGHKSLLVMDVASGNEVARLLRGRRAIGGVEFLPDGDRLLVVGARPGQRTGATPHTHVRVLQSASRGRRADCRSLVWDYGANVDPRAFAGCGLVSVSEDGTRLAVQGYGAVEVVDLRTGLPLALLALDEPRSIALGRTGHRLVAAVDRGIAVYEVDIGRRSFTIRYTGTGWLVSAADGRVRAVGDAALRCRAGARVYPWALCAGRYDADTSLGAELGEAAPLLPFPVSPEP